MTPRDDHGDLRDVYACDCVHHLGTVPGDAAVLVGLTNHEAGDILQEEQRHAALTTELHKMRALERRLAEEDAIVGDNANWVAVDVGESTHQRRAVAGLELMEARPVHDTTDDLADVERLCVVLGDHAKQLFRVIQRCLGLNLRSQGVRRLTCVRQDLAADLQRLRFVLSKVVGHARLGCVHVSTAKLLSRDILARCSLHERRTAKEDGAVALDNDILVGHCRHVRTTCRARAQDAGDLREARGRHVRLVVEDAAKVHAIREHLVLQGQERTARVHEVDARKSILDRDLLRPQVLLHRHRIVGAALDGRIVCHKEHLAPVDKADACHDAGRMGLPVVHVEGGQA
mmetsp:Transcript_45653/g.122749  ORF Transcript_45653/g.122749 Transcript_45653/m.122749 type:complete len:344 (-) Transcript_45653:720-1751(-)